jgi:hypothetical protein
MLYKDGYYLEKDVVPNHTSSQNRTPSPLPTVKEPLSKKFSLDFIRPFQKGESEDFVVT